MRSEMAGGSGGDDEGGGEFVAGGANTAKANKKQGDFIILVVDAAQDRMNEGMAPKKVLGDANMQRLFYLTGDGGVGKTSVYNVCHIL